MALRFRVLWRGGLGWALAAIALLLAECAVSAIWLVPAYTVDNSTVHRSLLAVSVASSLWLAALLVEGEPAGGEPERGGPARRAKS